MKIKSINTVNRLKKEIRACKTEKQIDKIIDELCSDNTPINNNLLGQAEMMREFILKDFWYKDHAFPETVYKDLHNKIIQANSIDMLNAVRGVVAEFDNPEANYLRGMCDMKQILKFPNL